MNTCWVRYTKSLDMEKALTPSRLDIDPSCANTSKEFNHWYKTFTYFLAVLPQEGLDKLSVLTNFVSAHVYDYIVDCETFEDAVDVLRSVFHKTENEVYARHILLSRQQHTDETLDQYLHVLKRLAKDCNFRPVDGATYCNEVVRDVFIAGLQSKCVARKLLNNKSLDVSTALEQARQFDSTADCDMKSPSVIGTDKAVEEICIERSCFTEGNMDNVKPGFNGGTKILALGKSSFTNIQTSTPLKELCKIRKSGGGVKKGIDAKNIISGTMNTRRKKTVLQSRLRSEQKQVLQSSKSYINKTVLRRVRTKLEQPEVKEKMRRRTECDVDEEDWGHVVKQSAMDRLRSRRSHRMRKPPERLDW